MKNFLKRNIVLLILLFITLKIFATNGITVDARFDSSEILIGDQIYFNIQVTQPKDAKVIVPEISDSLKKYIEILSTIIDTIPQGNYINVIKKQLITCFDSGTYKMDTVKFICSVGNRTDTIYSMPLSLIVHTIPIADSTKIADIKKTINLPVTFKDLMPYILISIGIILLILISILAYVQYKKNKSLLSFFQKPQEPPHVIAFRELEAIKNEKLWQQGRYKDYYSRITDVIRTYIERRFSILAMESTTNEIVNDLKNIPVITSDLLNELKSMLEIADMVKFAKAEPLPDENENSWQIAFSFVQKTLIEPEKEVEEVNDEQKKDNEHIDQKK